MMIMIYSAHNVSFAGRGPGNIKNTEKYRNLRKNISIETMEKINLLYPARFWRRDG